MAVVAPGPRDRDTAIGRRVRDLRLQRKIRQIDLAATAGLSWRHLIRIEQGEGGEAKAETIERLAAALDVDRSEITGETGGEDDEDSRAMLAHLTLDEFLRARVDYFIREAVRT